MLADGLKPCSNLLTLKLEWNSIGDDGTKALVDGLKHCSNLQTLGVNTTNDCMLTAGPCDDVKVLTNF